MSDAIMNSKYCSYSVIKYELTGTVNVTDTKDS